MFQIPKPMQDYWVKSGKPKATPADIARIEADIGTPLPTPYVEFVTQYGFVVFDDVPDMRMLFDYTVAGDGATEVREGDIGFLQPPDRLLRAYRILTTPSPTDPHSPAFPRTYLPVANDAGQGQILLDIGETKGRVAYWPERSSPWGTGDNTSLGFVANDFYEFINKLR